VTLQKLPILSKDWFSDLKKFLTETSVILSFHHFHFELLLPPAGWDIYKFLDVTGGQSGCLWQHIKLLGRKPYYQDLIRHHGHKSSEMGQQMRERQKEKGHG
ncbi:hypothetical protein IRJ41_010984, partial [Triplophysa rosa]